MNPHKLFRIGGLAVSGIIVGVLATSGNNTPGQWAKMALLKTLSVTPAVVQADQLENSERGLPSWQMAQDVHRATKRKRPGVAQFSPAPPGQMRPLSNALLLDTCRKQPRCVAKLQAAQKQGSNKPHFTEREESPETKKLKPKPVTLKAPRQQPRSDLMIPEETMTALLSRLNPFQVDPVYAQSNNSIHLTPAGPQIGDSYILLVGALVKPGNRHYLSAKLSFTLNHMTEQKPYALFQFVVPATGTYFINVRATSGHAKLRTGETIIETWNFNGQPDDRGDYLDYLTVEYLAQGYRHFYFWPVNDTVIIFSSASLTKYL